MTDSSDDTQSRQELIGEASVAQLKQFDRVFSRGTPELGRLMAGKDLA